MSKIIYNGQTLKIMALFERVTHANLKDCYIDENDLLTFVVSENQIGKAIGKNASNIKKLESVLKRKVKIVEYNPDLLQFVRNLIYPIRADEVSEIDGNISIKSNDMKTKSILIGRNAKNIKFLEKTIKKYFKINSVKVV